MMPDIRFEQYLARGQDEVTVFLNNGVKLSGALTLVLPSGDIFISRDGVSQKVYRRNIASLVPADAVPLVEILAMHAERRKAERGGL
jgi:sRNA-binding regulator protein Hfq